jgi:hypothetical protein
MPSSEAILGGLTAIANDWRLLAIGWHVLVGALLAGLLTGWRPAERTTGYLLIAPVASVSGMAWLSGNPFNGAIFAALALLLAVVASRLPDEPVTIAAPVLLVPGALLVAFAWVYPHFLETDRSATYLYAAPLGLLPCPTLSALVGVTLIVSVLRSKAWTATLAAAGLLYGAIGVFRLGVAIDSVLLAGAILLAGTVARSSGVHRPVRSGGAA